MIWIIFAVLILLVIFLIIYCHNIKVKNYKNYKKYKLHHKQAFYTQQPKQTVFYITKEQYASISKLIKNLVANENDIQAAIDAFIGVKNDAYECITYQIVEKDDNRSNYKYQKIGNFWQYCEPENKIKFIFRENETRVCKRIIQYFKDEQIDIISASTNERYVLLDLMSIHVGFLDYVSRFEDRAEICKTFGWRYKCVKRSSRCKPLHDLIIQGDCSNVRISENLYCKNINAYYYKYEFEKSYVRPIQQAFGRVYTELSLNNKIPVRYKGEKELLKLLSSIYPDVIYQYHPDWLKPQSLDFFIPSLYIGIEFQGEEHYKPFNSSEEAKVLFENQKRRDERKNKLCKDYFVKLIYWEFTTPITKQNLKKKLKELNIV